MSQAFSSANECNGQLCEIWTADIAQLDALEVIPNARIRIQVGSIARQLFQMRALGSSSFEKVLDRPSSMNRRTIPVAQEGNEASDLLDYLFHHKEELYKDAHKDLEQKIDPSL